ARDLLSARTAYRSRRSRARDGNRFRKTFMLILAIDTSNREGSVALGRGDAETFETLQLTPVEGGTYSARLLPTIDALLQHHSLSATDLYSFAIVSVPGSFSGLLVGLATVKWLFEILHKPLATVSML